MKLLFPLLFFFCGLLSANSQSEIPENIYSNEKISAEVGIGIHIGVIGARLKYFFSDYIGLTVGAGTVGTGLIWNAGLELRTPQIFTDRISPFFNVVYGVNSGINLSPPGQEMVTALFNGLSIGTGFKMNFIQKWNTNLSLGVNYRFISSSRAEFIDKYNMANGTNIGKASNINFYPIIGLTFCL